jgi:hypothetical protein
MSGYGPEILPVVGDFPGKQTGTVPGWISLGGTMLVAGGRLLILLQSRISLFAVAGGGFANLSAPTLFSGSLSTSSGFSGVVDAGGGVDVRLSRFFSARLDVRDYISGRYRGGATGRSHIRPSLGLVLHFP